MSSTWVPEIERREERRKEGKEGETKLQFTKPKPCKSASNSTVTLEKPSPMGEHMNVGSRFLMKLSNLFKSSSSGSARLQPSLATTLGSDPDNIQGLFSNFLVGLQEKVKNAKDINEVLLSHSIA